MNRIRQEGFIFDPRDNIEQEEGNLNPNKTSFEHVQPSTIEEDTKIQQENFDPLSYEMEAEQRPI